VTRRFPDGFIWGTATAAHQVEGGNTNNDWWAWEHDPHSGATESSGDACDHYHRYAEDLGLLAAAGFGAYRFSVEWSRIEPAEGEFSPVALDHYRRVCAACHEAGLVPVVTMHHFTTPLWAAASGGWADPAIVDRFARFCERTAGHLGDLIGWAATFNEPNVVAMLGYGVGMFPPGGKDHGVRRKVTDIMIEAHHRGAAALRAGGGRGSASGSASFPVGMTLSMQDYQAVDGGEEMKDRYRRAMEDPWLEAVAAGQDDFFGVQTYTRTRVGPSGDVGLPAGASVTQMGYERYPEALAGCIRRAREALSPSVPLLVTENGIATDDDADRIAFVHTALEGVLDCLEAGIDVRGYFYWSALDNFEWNYGYAMRFGLIGVDRLTFARAPKPSLSWLGEVARTNTLPPSA